MGKIVRERERERERGVKKSKILSRGVSMAPSSMKTETCQEKEILTKNDVNVLILEVMLFVLAKCIIKT